MRRFPQPPPNQGFEDLNEKQREDVFRRLVGNTDFLVVCGMFNYFIEGLEGMLYSQSDTDKENLSPRELDRVLAKRNMLYALLDIVEDYTSNNRPQDVKQEESENDGRESGSNQ